MVPSRACHTSNSQQRRGIWAQGPSKAGLHRLCTGKRVPQPTHRVPHEHSHQQSISGTTHNTRIQRFNGTSRSLSSLAIVSNSAPCMHTQVQWRLHHSVSPAVWEAAAHSPTLPAPHGGQSHRMGMCVRFWPLPLGPSLATAARTSHRSPCKMPPGTQTHTRGCAV